MRSIRLKETWYLTNQRTGTLYSATVRENDDESRCDAAQVFRATMKRLEPLLAKIPGVTAADVWYCDVEYGYRVNVYIESDKVASVLPVVRKTANAFAKENL